ncbi:MAG TPA: hypothetical protein VH306_03675 [Gaiellaceae bacterium]|jgi:hypothetical protein
MAAPPSGAAEVCARLELLRAICPRSVPEAPYGNAGPPIGVQGAYADGGAASCLDGQANAHKIGSTRCVYETFQLEAGAPTQEGTPPPRFAHATFYASRRPIPRLFGLRAWCAGGRKPLADGLVRRRLEQGVCLGPVRAGGEAGTLALEPTYPVGGEVGGHLVLSWKRGGVEYAATLHAWAPLRQAVAVLRRMVSSARA